MSERPLASTANALSTVWFIVLSVWCFMEGYTALWLAGVAAVLVGSGVTRVVLDRRKERGK